VSSANLETIMTFTQTCTIPASRDVVWDFLMQAENVARCLSGVEALKQLDQDNYEGILRVRALIGSSPSMSTTVPVHVLSLTMIIITSRHAVGE
jgi:carbon monoxide dehydrogenase subunit G